MKILLICLVLLVLSFLVSCALVIYDNYRYPICSKCGSNIYTKRIKGKIICNVHNEI
jgi:hypothetical protein